jgi:hypothetical protein
MRREVLQHGVVAGSLAFSGCIQTLRNGDSLSPETTTTEKLGALKHTASIIAQPSDQQPAKLRLVLKNEGDETITVDPLATGHPLEDAGPLVGERGDGVLLPRNTDTISIAGGEVPDSPTNGCWRFEPGETGTIEWTMYEYRTKIEPGETYAVKHGVYYDGPEDACFPAGAYRTENRLELTPRDGESRVVEFEYVLKVDASGTFSATVA